MQFPSLTASLNEGRIVNGYQEDQVPEACATVSMVTELRTSPLMRERRGSLSSGGSGSGSI